MGNVQWWFEVTTLVSGKMIRLFIHLFIDPPHILGSFQLSSPTFNSLFVKRKTLQQLRTAARDRGLSCTFVPVSTIDQTIKQTNDQSVNQSASRELFAADRQFCENNNCIPSFLPSSRPPIILSILLCLLIEKNTTKKAFVFSI